MAEYIELDRKFLPIEEGKEYDPESIRMMAAYRIDRQLSWDDLLKKSRVLILAAPGTGKTEEFLAVTQRLRATGEAAFFCRIDLLQDFDIRQAFEIGLGAREEFDEWLEGDQRGYFFLDSVDEALLQNPSAFEVALRRFSDALGKPANMDRAKVAVSSRTSSWQKTAGQFKRYLSPPKPKNNEAPKGEGLPVRKAGSAKKKTAIDIDPNSFEKGQEPFIFHLSPLNKKQIQRFAGEKGVDDTSSFLEAIEKADAEIFAERPQDLLDLITYWRDKGCLGSHFTMLEYNVEKKLNEIKPDLDARRPLSPEQALLGAERLAAAATFQKKRTIALLDQPLDADLREVSIEPKEALRDWKPSEIQPLLDRAIFDQANYGTVQFHHRSVREYLTARWLKRLLSTGNPIGSANPQRSVETWLFAERYGREVVIPSMRPIAAWLAIWNEGVRNRLRTIAPEVLIEYGDPSALSVEFRRSLLIEFTELHAKHKYTTGTSFDISMCRRLADPQLASTINDLLRKFLRHEDVCQLLLELIWQGQISGSVEAALPYASEDKASTSVRICAIRAVAAAGTSEQKRDLVSTLLSGTSKLDSHLLGAICDEFFPHFLSVPALLGIFKNAEPPKQYSVSPLQHSLEKIARTPLSNEIIEQLLQGLYRLLKSQPFLERYHCEISLRYGYLLSGTIKLANQLIRKRHPFSFHPKVFDLFLGFFVAQDHQDLITFQREGVLKDAEAWPEFRFKLFWHAVATARARESDNDRSVTAWWQVQGDLRGFWRPNADDLEHLFEDVKHKPLIDDQLIALTAIYTIYDDSGRSRQLRERMERAVNGLPELESKLQELLQPSPEMQKLQRYDRNSKRKEEARKKREEAIPQDGQQALTENPEEIKNVGNALKGEVCQRTAYLYERLREKKEKNEGHLGYANWKDLIDEFGLEVAKNFRDGCIAYWRAYAPFTYPNRRTDHSVPWSRIIGLSGIAMEAADDPEWVKTITLDEAKIAAHYAVCEWNGFPSWAEALRDKFSDVVDEVVEDELRWELQQGPTERVPPPTLSALVYAPEEFRAPQKAPLLALLSEHEPENDRILHYVLSLILEGSLDADFRKKVAELAYKGFERAKDPNRKSSWLIVICCVDGGRGYGLLKEWILALPVEARKETMVKFCEVLEDLVEHHLGRVVRDYERVEVLNELIPFIHKFVKVEEDIQHEGVYSPGPRDRAERLRSRLLNVIIDTPGRPSYNALMNLSTSLSSGYLKDRLDYLARERAALDAEFEPWSGKDVADFAESAEKQPRTEEELYQLALARLDDLKGNIEKGDYSEAKLYLKHEETVIRNSFANRLQQASGSRYIIAPEEELADKTRIDIRLHAPQVSAPVPIELKIADKWTLAELRERLENQLIRQYMGVSQYGIFLVVHNGRKSYWQSQSIRKRIDFTELIEMLKRDIPDLIRKHSISNLGVVGIDFTRRNQTI